VTKCHLSAESEYVRMAPRSGRGGLRGSPPHNQAEINFYLTCIMKIKASVQMYWDLARVWGQSPQLAVDPGAEHKLCARSVPVTKCDNITC